MSKSLPQSDTPQMTKCRVYLVAGYEKNRPFSSYNLWNDVVVDQARIEGYPSFAGWVTPEMNITELVENEVPPKKPNEFRVALMKGFRYENERYIIVHSGDKNSPSPQGMSNFVGWLSETITIEMPKPERKILLRFGADTPNGRIDGLFTTTGRAHRASIGRRANFGKVLGLSNDLEVVLQEAHFVQVSEDQTVIAGVTGQGRVVTVCGFNPLECLS